MEKSEISTPPKWRDLPLWKLPQVNESRNSTQGGKETEGRSISQTTHVRNGEKEELKLQDLIVAEPNKSGNEPGGFMTQLDPETRRSSIFYSIPEPVFKTDGRTFFLTFPKKPLLRKNNFLIIYLRTGMEAGQNPTEIS